MRLKLPTLLYYPCPCCSAPLFARAVVTPRALTTYQFCRKCAKVENRFRRGWGAALFQFALYTAALITTLLVGWLLLCLFLCLGGPQ